MGGQGSPLQRAPDCSGRTNTAQQQWRWMFPFIVLSVCLGVAAYVYMFPWNTCSEKEAELQSCQEERKRRNTQWDHKLQDMWDACNGGWQWGFSIVIIILFLVAILYRVWQIWQSCKSRETTLQAEKITWQTAWQDEKARLQKEKETWEQEKAGLQEEKTDFKNERDVVWQAWQNDKVTLEEQKAILEEQKATLEEKQTTLKEKVRELELLYAAKQEACSDLYERCNTLEEEYINLQKKEYTSQRENESLQRELENKSKWFWWLRSRP